MPNICSYEMRIKGKKDNIATLIEWLSAHYEYYPDSKIKCYNLKEGAPHYDYKDEDKIPCEHYIGYRVFECCLTGDIEEEGTDVFGDCAWSVRTCMFLDGYMAGDSKEKSKDSYAISLEDACRELDLEVEVFSEEGGMGFAEHYYINRGEVVCDECVDFFEVDVEYAKENEDFFEGLSPKLQEEVKTTDESYIRVCELLDADGGFYYEFL